MLSCQNNYCQHNNADYTIEVLPKSVFQHISPWLNTQLADIKYEDLKTMLLKKYCQTSSVRAQRILVLPQQPIFNRTPSQVGDEILTRLQLSDINEDTWSYKQLDLLLRLTPEVRITLVETDTCDTSTLVWEAEKRHNAYLAATHRMH